MGLSWVYRHPSLTGHARGLLTSLVILLLLWLSSAQLRVVGPDQPVTATVGQDVVLPCHLSPQRDARSLEVRWIQDKFSETVHHYRNGEDLYGEQMGAYAGRTELVRDGLSSGRLDLRITGLRPSDDGLYVCIVKDGDAYVEATVHLVVSDPFFQKCQTLIVVLVLVPVLFVVSIGLGVYCFRKQEAQRRELGESLQSLSPAPGEVVSVREGLVWVGSGGLCAGGSGVLEEQLEPGVGVGSAGAGAAQDTAGMSERNGDPGGDREQDAGLPCSAVTLLRQGRPPPIPIHFHLCFGGTVQRAAQVSVLTAPHA
ncbi:myelin-oligodendrocyte glycoprotein-like isoform X7 [Anas acuta]|uniref:myelin-oligodendrocyte glycoprotein-like isoform X7 n=1 Tax=Anas acuta TaxID=28680 RepID=UPI0035C9230C